MSDLSWLHHILVVEVGVLLHHHHQAANTARPAPAAMLAAPSVYAAAALAAAAPGYAPRSRLSVSRSCFMAFGGLHQVGIIIAPSPHIDLGERIFEAAARRIIRCTRRLPPASTTKTPITINNARSYMLPFCLCFTGAQSDSLLTGENTISILPRQGCAAFSVTRPETLSSAAHVHRSASARRVLSHPSQRAIGAHHECAGIQQPPLEKGVRPSSRCTAASQWVSVQSRRAGIGSRSTRKEDACDTPSRHAASAAASSCGCPR